MICDWHGQHFPDVYPPAVYCPKKYISLKYPPKILKAVPLTNSCHISDFQIHLWHTDISDFQAAVLYDIVYALLCSPTNIFKQGNTKCSIVLECISFTAGEEQCNSYNGCFLATA